MPRTLFFMFFGGLLFACGCAADIHEAITCQPAGAEIYWGPGPDQLANSGLRTPYSGTIPETEREAWCYQVRKEGYLDSEVLCREKERYRYFDFQLIPVRPGFSSDSTGDLKSVSEAGVEKKKGFEISGDRVTLTWEDNSTGELGFKIEKKEGINGTFREIGSTGPLSLIHI